MMGEAYRQSNLCRRNAFPATGADTQFAGDIAHARGAAFDSGLDVSVRNSFADAYDHGMYLNANANDCQYCLLRCVKAGSRHVLCMGLPQYVEMKSKSRDRGDGVRRGTSEKNSN
jgi:hypothetical protein